MKTALAAASILFLLISCATDPPAVSNAAPPIPAEVPEDARSREAAEIRPADASRPKLADFVPVPAPREIVLRVFPQTAVVSVLSDQGLRPLVPTKRDKDTARYATDAGALLLGAPDYNALVLPLPPGGGFIEARLERPSGVLSFVGEAPTDYQPKSVRFSPDGRYVFVANLGDFPAVGQFSVAPLERVRDLEVPPEYREAAGFVETSILPKRGEIWVSQMTRDALHVFDIDTGKYLATVPVSGRWPKVLLADPDETRMYVSCWEGGTIVEVDTALRTETRSFTVGGTPRGMIFSSDGRELWTTQYEGSGIDRINLETGEIESPLEASETRVWAFRHIVHDERRGEYYITAMAAGRVFRLSDDGRWLGSWDVGEKPNTCQISPDGRWLFVSCRGPNNPDTGYLTRGYEYGKVYVIDLDAGEVDGWIWGRDQPTGLDVSPDGRFLAFSDFLSHSLELYAIQ